jgi:hypothetical protein
MSADAANWLATSRPGICGKAESGPSDCSGGDTGSFSLPKPKTSDWDTAVLACLLACSRCDQCKYVSISLRWEDCSWFSSCDLDALGHDVLCFRSGAAVEFNSTGKHGATHRRRPHSTRDLAPRTPPPAPPPLAPAPIRMGSSSVVILHASNHPPPPALDGVLEWPRGSRDVPVARKGAIRSLTSTLTRAYAALHGYAYVYAQFPAGCGRSFVSWCSKIPPTLALLRERLPNGEHRYGWVLDLDEDVAINSAASFAQFLDAARERLPRAARSKGGCYGRCLPPGMSDLSDTDCPADHYASEHWPPCLLTAKDAGGWPGVNSGVVVLRNGAKTHSLLREWWEWPLRRPSEAERDSYLHSFPGDQNALNDAITSAAAFRPFVHVLPNADLYQPGTYAQHFTGVDVDKDRMFLSTRPPSAISALLRFPAWSATACMQFNRTVKLPAANAADSSSAASSAGEGTAARDVVSVELVMTSHCLDVESMRRLVNELRTELWSGNATPNGALLYSH